MFLKYSPLSYYFDEEMVELGYTVNGKRGFFDQTAGREWSKELLDQYYLQHLPTSNVLQEGRR